MNAADIFAMVLQWGPAGVVLVMLLTGILVTRRELVAAQGERDQWRTLYEQESQAHTTTREALNRERERMDAALESSRTTEAFLRYLGHGVSPPSQPELPASGGRS